MDLMQLMMGKIKRTEARCAIFESESKQKDMEIGILHKQIESIKKTSHEYPQHGGPTGIVYKLEKENLALRNKVTEMEVGYVE